MDYAIITILAILHRGYAPMKPVNAFAITSAELQYKYMAVSFGHCQYL